MKEKINPVLFILLILATTSCLSEFEEERESGFTQGELTLITLSILPAYWLERGCPGPDVAYLDFNQTYTHRFNEPGEQYWFTYTEAKTTFDQNISFTEKPGQEIRVRQFDCQIAGDDFVTGDSGSPGSAETIKFGPPIMDPNQFPRTLGIISVELGDLEITFRTSE